MRENADAHLYQYLDATFAEETPLLKQVRLKGESMVKGMQISPHEGKMLYVLATLIRAKRILEVGTFAGYSTLWLAQAAGAEGHIDTLEANNDNADVAQSHFDASDYKDNITIHHGKALASLDILCNEATAPYDLVFIDAAKGEYAEYLEKVTPYVRTGGAVIGDNTLLFGHMIDAPKKDVSQKAIAAMNTFNATLAQSEHFQGIMFPTAEGLTIGIKK